MDYNSEMINKLIEAQSKQDKTNDALFDYIQELNDKEDFTHDMLLITREYVKKLEQYIIDLQKELDELKKDRQN